MNNSFVMSLWSAFEPTEHKKILKFLDSPLHNQREDVKLLAKTLAQLALQGYPDVEKPVVFNAIFPNQPYNNLQFNHICSFLTQRLESYLVLSELETEGFWRNYLLCHAFRRRGMQNNYLRKTEKALQELAQQPLRNSFYHLFRYLMERERYEYRVLFDRETPSDLSAVTEPLEHFFTLENLRWAGTALSLQARYGVKNDWPFHTKVLEYAQSADEVKKPEIVLMHLGYETLKDVENEENFQRLKTLINSNDEKFSAGEQRDLYLLAINFCLRRHNRGERPHYTREALELYREVLKRGLFLENNHLQKYTYNNIVRLACIAGEWEWAKEFLEQYQSKLPDEERENVYKFNLASWHYLNRNYSQVPALLQTFEFTDRDTQLNARQMLLRSFFELQEWQALDSLLRSFYSFIRRRHDIGYQRISYLNLIKYTRKLMAGTLSRPKATQLRKRIEKEQYVAEREWLLEKLNK